MIAWERQRRADGAWDRALHPGDGPRANAAFRRAERLWGGPLPGIARAISTAPLRVEMYGWPPERFVAAAGVPAGHPALSHYWQLAIEGRRAVGVYHSLAHLAALPALPAGLALCPATACLRSRHDWETAARFGPVRLYVLEDRPGAAARAWPGLAPAEPAGRGGWYGVDYDPETLAVTGVQAYRADYERTSAGSRWVLDTLGRLGRPEGEP